MAVESPQSQVVPIVPDSSMAALLDVNVRSSGRDGDDVIIAIPAWIIWRWLFS